MIFRYLFIPCVFHKQYSNNPGQVLLGSGSPTFAAPGDQDIFELNFFRMSAGKEDIVHRDKRFENINYEGKSLSNRVFIKCVFYKCSLKECFFDDSAFEDCTFDECDISLLKFKYTSFKNITLSNTKAVGVMWVDAENPFSITATKSRLSYSSFYGKKMKKVNLINCIADEVDFSECDLTQATFTGTDLRRATFSNSILTKADFVGALNYAIDTRSNKLSGAKFSLPEALSFLDALGIELVDPNT